MILSNLFRNVWMIFELSDNISIDEDLFSAICSKTMSLTLKWDYMPLT